MLTFEDFMSVSKASDVRNVTMSILDTSLIDLQHFLEICSNSKLIPCLFFDVNEKNRHGILIRIVFLVDFAI